MHKIYTTRYLNAVSFICSIIIFTFICLISKKVNNHEILFSSIFKLGNPNTIKVQFDSIEDTNTENVQKTEKPITENTQEITKEPEKQWNLKIPKIFLEAKIEEGTSAEIMNAYIGHFEETSKTTGNIGLAAHNRGYPVNYFENLKHLKTGDTIEYQYNEYKKEYTITENNIIKDTNWEYLEKTEENTITLITCEENEPEYRRCVIGKERKDD